MANNYLDYITSIVIDDCDITDYVTDITNINIHKAYCGDSIELYISIPKQHSDDNGILKGIIYDYDRINLFIEKVITERNFYNKEEDICTLNTYYQNIEVEIELINYKNQENSYDYFLRLVPKKIRDVGGTIQTIELHDEDEYVSYEEFEEIFNKKQLDRKKRGEIWLI